MSALAGIADPTFALPAVVPGFTAEEHCSPPQAVRNTSNRKSQVVLKRRHRLSPHRLQLSQAAASVHSLLMAGEDCDSVHKVKGYFSSERLRQQKRPPAAAQTRCWRKEFAAPGFFA
jgi:hypothetical protein